MVFFNYALRKLNAKIVYYGPGLCGKTTNLQWIHDHFEGGEKGKMVSLATEGDRTIFFDLLPLEIGRIRGMDVTLQLYTVPGQVHYNSTRQLVLRGADGVVFVADSQKTMRGSNEDSLRNLEENLSLQGINLAEFPHVLQFNKRDLGDLLPGEDMDASLNDNAVPIFEAVAIEGIGVQETLEGIVKLVMRSLKERYEARTPEMRPIPAATAAGTAGPWPVNLPTTAAPSTASAIPNAAPPGVELPASDLSSIGSDPVAPPPVGLFEPAEQDAPAPEDVDTHTDILFPDEDAVDELDEPEPDLADEAMEDSEGSPVAEEMDGFQPPVTAPPLENIGTPLEPQDEEAWTMPFETVDINNLPAVGADAPDADKQPETFGPDDEEQDDIESLSLEDGLPEPPDDEEGQVEVDELPAADEIRSDLDGSPAQDETKSDRLRPSTAKTAGVEDLVASILDSSERSPETASDVPAFPEWDEAEDAFEAVSEPEEPPDVEVGDESIHQTDEEGFADMDQDVEPGAAEGIIAGPSEEEVFEADEAESPFDSGPSVDQRVAVESADDAAPVSAAQTPDRRPGPPVAVVFDDGDPFGGDGWDTPSTPVEPSGELLPASDPGGDEVSTPVEVAVADNSLALKLTGTGAIVESGQVRAIDIEVPVPGAWVGHNRVTMQLRLTLVPAPEDEDA